VTRRDFVQLPQAAALAAQTAPSTFRTSKAAYAFDWSRDTDRFRLLDSRGLVVTTGLLQPVVIVHRSGQRHAAAGKVAGVRSGADFLAVTYEAVNGGSALRLELRFDEDGLWIEPIAYDSAAEEDIVSLHYFAEADADEIRPNLRCTHWVVPGFSESSHLGPLIQAEMGFNATCWLGHGGSTDKPGLMQQWGLPSHFYCGFTRNTPRHQPRKRPYRELVPRLLPRLGRSARRRHVS